MSSAEHSHCCVADHRGSDLDSRYISHSPSRLRSHAVRRADPNSQFDSGSLATSQSLFSLSSLSSSRSKRFVARSSPKSRGTERRMPLINFATNILIQRHGRRQVVRDSERRNKPRASQAARGPLPRDHFERARAGSQQTNISPVPTAAPEWTYHSPERRHGYNIVTAIPHHRHQTVFTARPRNHHIDPGFYSQPRVVPRTSHPERRPVYPTHGRPSQRHREELPRAPTPPRGEEQTRRHYGSRSVYEDDVEPEAADLSRRYRRAPSPYLPTPTSQAETLVDSTYNQGGTASEVQEAEDQLFALAQAENENDNRQLSTETENTNLALAMSLAEAEDRPRQRRFSVSTEDDAVVARAAREALEEADRPTFAPRTSTDPPPLIHQPPASYADSMVDSHAGYLPRRGVHIMLTPPTPSTTTTAAYAETVTDSGDWDTTTTATSSRFGNRRRHRQNMLPSDSSSSRAPTATSTASSLSRGTRMSSGSGFPCGTTATRTSTAASSTSSRVPLGNDLYINHLKERIQDRAYTNFPTATRVSMSTGSSSVHGRHGKGCDVLVKVLCEEDILCQIGRAAKSEAEALERVLGELL